MTKKRIFITGGGGFLGKSLCRYCKEMTECEVTFLLRSISSNIDTNPFFKNDKFSFIQGDVRDFDSSDYDFDYILHAATTSSKAISSEEARSVIIDGTKHLLEFAKKNKSLKNLLYISSGAVYGKYVDIPFAEDLVCKPETIYGESKLEAEGLCLESSLSCTVARLFAFVGEDLPLEAHFAIGNFISNCLKGEDFILKGDGSAVRSYMSAEDLAVWLWKLLIQDGAGQIYNVGSDQEISVYSLAELVKTLSASEGSLSIQGEASEKKLDYYVPNIQKAKKEQELSINISLKEALKKILAYHASR